MEKNLHEIDQLFLDSLESYEEQPSENVWASIENDLNKKDVTKYKAKYKFLLRTIICATLLLASLLINDIQIHNYNVKQNGRGIANLKAKQSATENNKLKNKKDNSSLNHVYATKPVENNLYAFKPGGLKKDIETADNKIFQDDKFYRANQIQPLDSMLISNKRNNFLFPENLAARNNDPEKLFNFFKHASGKNLMTVEQTSKQTNKSPQQRSKHDFYIIPFFSFDIVTARLKEQYKYDNQDQLDVAQREKPDPSYTAGLLAEYEPSKKFSIQSGILLSTSFTTIAPTIVRAVQDNSGAYKFKLATTYGLAEIKKPGINPQNGDSIRMDDASLRLRYISLPVIVKYKIKPGKFTISSLTGVGINRIINEKMEVEYVSNTNTETEIVEKIEGLKKTFITFIAGAEASYNINKKISVGLSPTIRYSVTPVNQGTPIKTFPVTISTAALVKIKL